MIDLIEPAMQFTGRQLSQLVAFAISVSCLAALFFSMWASRWNLTLFLAIAGLVLLFLINALFYVQVLFGVSLVPVAANDLSPFRSLASLAVMAPYPFALAWYMWQWRKRGQH